jgi:hypothetical protein
VSYFAPDPRLAAGNGADAAARELKQVIQALHGEGIEVILQARGSRHAAAFHPACTLSLLLNRAVT